MIRHVSTIYCEVQDMVRMAAFYELLLQAPPVIKSDQWTSFRLGEIAFALHPAYSEFPPRGGWVVSLETDDLAEEVERLEAVGVEFEGGMKEIPTGLMSTLYDPEGHRVELHQKRLPG